MATTGTPRDWCFTVFVYDDEEKLALFACPQETFDASNPAFKYATWQIEKAPTTGNLHVQGFLMLRKQMGMRAVKEVGEWNAVLTLRQMAVSDNRPPSSPRPSLHSQMLTWRSAEGLSLKRVTTAVRRLLGRLARGTSAPTTRAARVNAAICNTLPTPSAPWPSPASPGRQHNANLLTSTQPCI